MTKETLVIVGLGNPGQEYAMTRHNMGYLLAQALAKKLGWSFKEEKQRRACVAKGIIGQRKVHIVLPTTFMNLSGLTVRNYANDYKLSSDHFLVIVDDVAFDLGEMRLLASGSSGGHNGLKSVEQHLETQNYKRLRVGIGSKGDQTLEEYVLAPFNADERKQLPEIINKGVDILVDLFKEQFANVMSKVNRRRQDKNESPEQSLK